MFLGTFICRELPSWGLRDREEDRGDYNKKKKKIKFALNSAPS